MINSQQPNVPTLVDPIEIDKAIMDLQLRLDLNLTWLSHEYGRAYRHLKIQNNNRVYFPEVYTGKQDDKYMYYRPTPDNDKSGLCFFVVGDETNDFAENQHNYLTYDLGIVFWANLKLIDDSKLNTELFTQNLIKEVREVLTRKLIGTFYKLKIERVVREFSQIYSEFTIDEKENYLMAPYQGFRFNCTIELQEDCNTNPIDTCQLLQSVVTADELRSCLLPTIDFSITENLDALSDQQISDICVPIPCDDGTVNVKDSSGLLLDSVTVASGGVIDKTITDSALTNSNGTFNDVVKAQGSKVLNDITHTDTDSTPVTLPAQTPMVCSTPPVALNNSSLTKTGATTSYQTNDDGQKKFGSDVDFFTLSYNNPFGNTNRFTDDLGTQLYASNVVVDWKTHDQVSSKVLCYYLILEPTATLTVHIDNQPFTRNSLTEWWMVNPREGANLFNYSVYRDYLNYPPFNFNTTATSDRIWTSFRESVSVGVWIGGFTLSVAGHGGSYKTLLRREYLLSELGL